MTGKTKTRLRTHQPTYRPDCTRGYHRFSCDPPGGDRQRRERPRVAAAPTRFAEPVRSDASDVLGFIALTALPDVEFDRLTRVEGPVDLSNDVGVVNEHIGASVTGDEAEAPITIEKLDRSLH